VRSHVAAQRRGDLDGGRGVSATLGEVAREFRVTFEPPLDIPASLELFRRSGDDLIDRWDGQRLVRALRVGSAWVPFVAIPEGSVDAPAMRVIVQDPTHEPAIRAVAECAFVPAPPSYAALLASDNVLGTLNARFPGIRQIRQLDLFTALVRCISAQQVNLRWAVTTRRRLAETFTPSIRAQSRKQTRPQFEPCSSPPANHSRSSPWPRRWPTPN
jgi:hypothetical protein